MMEVAGPGRGGGACPEPRPRSQSPFSQLRARAAYLRKSLSVDDHLGVASEPGAHRQPRAAKGKLKRKFVSAQLPVYFLFRHLVDALF